MTANVERKIRKRNPNWDDVEKGILRKCLEKKMGIIENKCTDTNTNKQKKLAWQKVLQRFNELIVAKEVKQQWRTMKIEAKKCDYNYKKALRETGGGQTPPSPDPTTVEIMAMLPLEFEEDINKFDSDTITQNHTVTKEVFEENDITNKHELEKQESETLVSTPRSSKRTLPKKYPSLPKKRKCKPDEPNLLQTIKERNAVLTNVIEKESVLKIKHMTEAHEWAREEHRLKIENLILKKELLTKQVLELNK